MRPVSELISLLNKYPHVQQKLTDKWGTQDCKDFLISLLLTERPNRQGFSAEEISIIQELRSSHDKFYPQFNPRDIWNMFNYNEE
jgi:hypothetical protein